MRKTKIICTIGPASENEEVLTQMCLAGMNVARLNFSHGTHDEHAKKIELIKSVRQKLEAVFALGRKAKAGHGLPMSKNLVDGRVILLVDDIYTTGGTAEACTRVLLDAGARTVYLVNVCIGENEG